MVEITATLLNGSTFFTNESIECLITLSCPAKPELEVAQGSSNSVESIAWVSAQIHCQCSINEKLIEADKVLGNTKPVAGTSDTSFAPSNKDIGHTILNTKPKILICDLKLKPGERKSFSYKEAIPSNSPPSYRGSAVKYAYKITIGAQRVNQPTKLLKIPFRVLSLKDLPEGAACSESAELTPNNPFLEGPKETPTEIAMELLENITARRSPNFYNITNGNGKVVRFCLFKNNYKLGEDIVGTFDFSNSNVTCTQITVTLQSEEHIAEDYLKGKAAPAINDSNKHSEVVLGYMHTYLNLPIPFHITPDFSTDLVTLKWRLHFEFVTSVKPLEFPTEETMSWQAPISLEVEPMTWDLPIHLYPTQIPPNITPVVQNSDII
ncbi:unnamed protein product [Trichogramma brassicae]|uniref:Arrestin C-terminal-like domain-containing protein n=1 Tax=Trichogramma brassicae TaxID=86971 RepID=A0A6H5IQE8_9HYME|nr:RAB6A-GEF complex partner protein 2 [Trichogramma pretiosum]CAB0037817.1 unnamed protein product [Trichogramma brassicae]